METRRSRSRLQTKTNSDPRNRYTAAPLVINHANAIDLAEAFLQANREHKQERDERNLKLQINMRLMKIRRSSSLYSKRTNCHRRTKSRTRALVHSKWPWQRQLQQNNVYFTRKSRTKQNPNPKEERRLLIIESWASPP